MKLRSIGLLATMATTTLALAGTAQATTAKAPAPGTSSTAPAPDSGPSPSAQPPGFQIVSSFTYTAPGNVQTHGVATCPTNKQPYGGGAIVFSAGFPVFLNSSYPTSTGWAVDVNNQSSVSSGFTAYAVCLSKSTSYTVATTSATAVNGVQTSTAVACPAGTKVMGGGVLSLSGSTAVNINSTLPFSNGWRADMNNTQGVDTTFTIYAVCRKGIAGYAIRTSGAVTNPIGGSQTIASVSFCPGSAAKAISGGSYSGSSSTSVNLNSSIPNGGWSVFEQNFSAADTTVTAYAICAGT